MHFESAGFVENGMLSQIAPLCTVTTLNETTERRSVGGRRSEVGGIRQFFLPKSGWNIADVMLLVIVPGTGVLHFTE